MNAVLLFALALAASSGPHCGSTQAVDVPNSSGAGAATVRMVLGAQAYAEGYFHLTRQETNAGTDLPRDELQSYLSLHVEILGATAGASLNPWADLRSIVEPGAQSSARANRISALDGSHACS